MYHIARTTFGMSGGPVLNADGEVVGVSIEFKKDEKNRFAWSIAATATELKNMLEREKEHDETK